MDSSNVYHKVDWYLQIFDVSLQMTRFSVRLTYVINHPSNNRSSRSILVPGDTGAFIVLL
jgi:hypothetical protein